MIFDMQEFSKSARYHLMTQSIIPRPIAWVLSKSSSSPWNLAPFSYFTAISSEPPLIMVSIGIKKSGELKDTRRNLENGGRAVVHIAPSSLISTVQNTASELEREVSEVEQYGLELSEVKGLEEPIVKGCSVALQCRHYETKKIVDQCLLFLEVEKIWVDDAVVALDSKQRPVIDPGAINPLARLGAGKFASLGDVLRP